jgi:hypothetical protein
MAIRLDGVSESEVEIVPMQEIPAAISELGSLVQTCGEADIAETVIVLTLTKEDGVIKPILEVMFAGNPDSMEKMMQEGLKIVRKLEEEAVRGVSKITETSLLEPWNYM